MLYLRIKQLPVVNALLLHDQLEDSLRQDDGFRCTLMLELLLILRVIGQVPLLII